MKTLPFLVVGAFFSLCANAQVGIGTTSPHSTLDVRGSFSTGLRIISANATLATTDHSVIFTGGTAITVTLPDAATCAGRMYQVKNASTTSPTPVLTIATTSAQTIDGAASLLLDDVYEMTMVVSNGTNWIIMSQGLPSNSGFSWSQNGNTVSGTKTLGTISNHDLPFITNNTEKMRIAATGNVGIGSSSFDASNPEKLLVDAGNTSSFNVISGKGSIDNYLQLNIQNRSAGGTASSDVVASADNATESVNFIDFGINSSGFSNVSYPIIGGANNAYLYSTGNDFVIGNATAAKNLKFFTGGYALTNERMRIDGTGNVGIGNTAPTQKLDITGNLRFSGALMPNGSAGTLGYILTSSGAGAAPTWQDGSTYVTNLAWLQGGNSLTALKNLGTTSNFALPFITNNTEKMRLTTAGQLGIGTTTPSELLDVNGNIKLTGSNRSIFFDGATDPYAGIKNVSRAGEINELMLFSGNDIEGAYGADRIRLATHEIHLATGSANGAVNTGDPTAYYENTTNVPTRLFINETGNVGIGTTTFDATSPEALLIDAGSATYTALLAKGNINNYFQINIKNSSAGTQGSSDLVATANNGTETTNFVNLGINGSGYVYQTGNPIETGKANDGYLISSGNDFYVVNNNVAKDMIFLTGGTAPTNEAMRITSTERVGIGTTAPTSTLSVNGSQTVASRVIAASATLGATDYVVINTGGAVTYTLPAANSCTGRVYKIINHGTGNITLSIAVTQASGSTFTSIGTIAGSNLVDILSDGTTWRRIN